MLVHPHRCRPRLPLGSDRPRPPTHPQPPHARTLQFGKRLLREASRTRWAASYIDYKQLKHAIKQDVAAKGMLRWGGLGLSS